MSIPQYILIHFHMQRFKFIDLMVIELRFFKKKNKKKKMKNKRSQCLAVTLPEDKLIIVGGDTDSVEILEDK